MNSKDLKETGEFDEFSFPVSRFGRRLQLPTKQYVHSTGTIFFRLVKDANAQAVVIVYENRRYVNGDDELMKTAREVFVQLKDLIGNSTALLV